MNKAAANGIVLMSQERVCVACFTDFSLKPQ